ncbi:phenylalanine--tRNA ligase subunit beta [Myroides marinus]|uniref:phenylalanine--tRNA ligase subunit beta n=1 Tax=Myroides marinus TaxID=703342 RepID=UPI0025779465|nr:phenylalanine--tRNA ligase subunit beta [Myroides marinus]MDM1373401.1 phenylalanine--tRNA ligase subunit beta [Myroides marinus]MDM1391612.1 phenylalanine--tRNA ligase subunit beta [Myroides marinus]MDM1405883.1 phenylalanine--tRNA ligase subunit beta [Myroides marinus]MDM1534148.1 phenylalanine--tRNA ligase subunit beta [Myroides marinus]MDM1541120.1 phenylalanine--tRNA ligase subunit beta [Myroides marinus]
MHISYNWLKQFIKLDITSEETSEILTDLGLEVEGITQYESLKGGLRGVVVGHVLSCTKHPNADKLNVTKVDLGTGEPVQIVCGAPNVAAGQKVPVATIGTELFDAEGNAFQIKKGKIRGEESFGMICSEVELGLGTDGSGILVLDEKWAPGTPAATLFNITTDEVFEIGLTPNRSDAMSHWGVARDLRASLLQNSKEDTQHKELITPSVSKFKVERRTLKIDVVVDDYKKAPRYCGVTISGVEVKASPDWLQDRLKAIGIAPKNNIVDVTNYVLHDLGQPLHAFDAAKIKGGKVFVKTVDAGTKFVTLDGVERTLHQDDLMICDENGPMCIAGVFGGSKSAVSENTSTIFLESAYFNPVTVRKAAKRHGLNTDSSFRFERGVDPAITEYALKHAALLIQQVAGGEITSDIIDLYPKKVEEHSVFLNFNNITRLLGEEISKETIKKILVSLDIKVHNMSDIGIGITVPAYRADVTREIDVIEEILRVYGFNNITFSSKLNATIANSSRTEDHRVTNIVAQQLVAQGFHEIMNNSLTTPAYTELSENIKSNFQVDILNPLSYDLSVMRQSLLFGGLESIAYNVNRKRGDLKFFEFGKTYHKMLNNYEEYKRLSVFATGNITKASWNSVQKPITFFEFKGYINGILARLGFAKVTTQPVESDVFSEGIAYYVGKEAIVEFGILKKHVTKHFDIKQEVCYAEFNWDNVLKVVSAKIKLTEINKFPSVKRDYALLIDEAVTFEDIYNIVKQVDKAIIKDVTLFDVYQGDKIEDGKKSYAISIHMEDTSKTLTDSQVDKIMSKIQYQLENNVNAQIR